MEQDSEIANSGAEIRHFGGLQGLRPGAGFGGSIVTIASRSFWVCGLSGVPGVIRPGLPAYTAVDREFGFGVVAYES